MDKQAFPGEVVEAAMAVNAMIAPGESRSVRRTTIKTVQQRLITVMMGKMAVTERMEHRVEMVNLATLH